MSSKIYRQYDSRWCNKPYPTAKSTFGGNGCGPCAVLHLMLENPKYANYTPETVRPEFIKRGYAEAGHGTTWNGITAMMRYYGLKNIVRVWNEPMSEAWKVLNKGKKMGIILFLGGTKGGVTWTLGGHYVAFTDYKVKNGKHYFYMKDSGPRKHDGWYNYEDHMKGLVSKMWICDKPSKAYSGKLPVKTVRKGSKGEDVKRWQRFLNWYYGKDVLKVDGNFQSKTESYTRAFQSANGLKVDVVVGKKTIAKAKAARK